MADTAGADEAEELRSLLLLWQTNAKRSQIANYEAATKLSKRSRRLGMPAVVGSAFVGTSVFASLESLFEPWGRVAVGSVSMLAVVLTSLQTWLKPEELAAKHRATAAEYGAIKRQIHQILSTGDHRQDGFRQALDRIRDRMDALSREAPVLPGGVWEKAKRTVPLAQDRA